LIRPILAATVLIRPSSPGPGRRPRVPDDGHRGLDLSGMDDCSTGGGDDFACVVTLNTGAALLE